MNELQEVITKIMHLARASGKPAAVMGLHLTEEVGEFAEGTLWELGYLPHKTMKEPLIGEAADVIQNIVATLTLVYPHWTPERMTLNVIAALQLKTNKWEDMLHDDKPS